MAAGVRLPQTGQVFLSLADRDKNNGLVLARQLRELGFRLAATVGTAGFLRSQGVDVDTLVAKVGLRDVAHDAVGLEAAIGAEQLAEITQMAAEEMMRFGLRPKAALLSHSNFGSSNCPSAVKMRDALALILSGGPASVYADGAPQVDPAIYELGVPMLDGGSGEDLVVGGVKAGHAAREDYVAHRYHKPQDEYDPNWNKTFKQVRERYSLTPAQLRRMGIIDK